MPHIFICTFKRAESAERTEDGITHNAAHQEHNYRDKPSLKVPGTQDVQDQHQYTG